ncbi:hypothetical protein C2G38_2168300 [Gigaspora rosea]|uniref:Uncharacterized protein n=1 Tax=Gigaspora rosea TaxID=44941 RepID=A0A397VX51_9GLOM|nr:hypothetical protein C2G38_2168300 [Gigaspora rosea]
MYKICINNCGPCWVYLQYPIERLCGMLQPMQFQSRQVVWIKDDEEELWAPKEPILELNDWGVKYAKFRTREGYMIGSLMSTVAVNARDNSCVLYELEVNISKPREAKTYELWQYFGRARNA